MATSATQPDVVIVGAGLAGTFLAVYLGQRGFRVRVYERRGDIRSGAVGGGPSMNLGLSQRGLRALQQIDFVDRAMALTIPMRGRMVHGLDGALTFQSYGQDDQQVIYAIKRNDLNIALIDAAAALPNVDFFFNHRCTRLDKRNGIVHFRDEQTNEERQVQAAIIVGADGVFSTIRQEMQRGEQVDYMQEFLDWGWKELTIPAGPAGAFQLEKYAFHLWPRGNCMIFAHPNLDGAFCCSCLLPYEGEVSFSSLSERERVRDFFAQSFGDIVPLSPTLVDDFLRNPVIPLMSIRTSSWYYKDRVVLIGDACHAVFPFYAQGMNAAFEDCLALGDCLQRYPDDRERAFRAYQALRKPNTDVLADISRQNFIELRDKVRSPVLRARKRIDGLLGKLFPRTWMPLHALVTHTTIPYSEALSRARRQDNMLKWLLLGVMMSVLFPLRGTLQRILDR